MTTLPSPTEPSPWPAPPYRTPPGWSPPAPSFERASPHAKPLRPRELALVAGVVAVADLVTFAGSEIELGGLGLATFLAVGAAVVALALRTSLRASLARSPVRLATTVGLLVLVVLRALWAPTIGTTLSGAALLFAFAVALRLPRVRTPGIALAALRAIPTAPARIASAVRGVVRLLGRTQIGRRVILPLAVPFALCLVFLGVFSLANPVVERLLHVAVEKIARICTLPSPGRLFFWGIAALSGLFLVRPSIVRARGDEASHPTSDVTELQRVVAKNTLVAMNVLFAAYLALDAAYLWAGSPPPGTTTQAYAHQGAFWLTIALALLTVVVGVLFRGPLAHDAAAVTVRRLAYAWAAEGLLLAACTYRRIGIHVARSGLSDLRIVGVLGTTLVAVGLVLVVVKLARTRTWTWLVRRQLDAFALTAIVYAIFPTHLVSARVNVARIDEGEYRPLLHMFRQSTEVESADELLPLLSHSDVRVRQGVAALLLAERHRLRVAVEAETTWRSRDLAARRTLARLDAAAPRATELLAGLDPSDARQVLFELSKAANEDRSLEEIYAIIAADRDAVPPTSRAYR